MPAEFPGTDLARAMGEISELRHFSGLPKEFWPRFLAVLGSLTHATHASLILRNSGESPVWRRLGDWSTGASRLAADFTARLDQIAQQCIEENIQLCRLDGGSGRGTGHYVIATRARLYRPE